MAATPTTLRQMRQKSNGKQDFFDAEIAVMRSAFKEMIEGDMSITVNMVDLCMNEQLSAVLEKYGYSKVLNRIQVIIIKVIIMIICYILSTTK